jgi:hypothetical protein
MIVLFYIRRILYPTDSISEGFYIRRFLYPMDFSKILDPMIVLFYIRRILYPTDSISEGFYIRRILYPTVSISDGFFEDFGSDDCAFLYPTDSISEGFYIRRFLYPMDFSKILDPMIVLFYIRRILLNRASGNLASSQKAVIFAYLSG